MLDKVKGWIPAQLIPRLLPKPASRYPADPRAVFILILCVVAGLPLLIAGAEPGSLEALMPRWFIGGWGLFLVGGAGMTLWGMGRQTIDGILVEQVGSVAVGSASLVYGTAIVAIGVLKDDAGVGFSSIIIFGWGLSCFWRWFQLQALIHQGIETVERVRGNR